MRFVRAFSVLIGVALLVSSQNGLKEALAESSVQPPFLGTPYGKQTAELLKLRLLRLESTLSRTGNLVGGRSGGGETKAAARGQTVSVLEDLLILNCSTGSVTEWSFPKAESLSAECTQYSAELRKLAPDSFVLSCIKEGSESEHCSKIFSAQHVIPMRDALSIPALMNDIHSIEGDSLHGTYQKISGELQQLKLELLTADNEDKKSNIQAKIHQANIRAADAACKGQPLILYDSLESIGITVESFQENADPEVAELKRLVKDYQSKVKDQATKAPQQAPNFEPDSAANFTGSQNLGGSPPITIPEVQPPARQGGLRRSPSRREGGGSQGYFPPFQHKPAPLATPTKNESWSPKPRSEEERKKLARIRILTDNCFNQLQVLQQTDPDSRLALCLREGQFHPHCIRPPERSRVRPTASPSAAEGSTAQPSAPAQKEKGFAEF